MTAPRGGEGPQGPAVLEVAALPKSLGPRRVADLLADSLCARGIEARLVVRRETPDDLLATDVG